MLFNSLRNCKETSKKEIITLKSYLKQDNELDFNIKLPLLRHLQFPSDLKSTIICCFV